MLINPFIVVFLRFATRSINDAAYLPKCYAVRNKRSAVFHGCRSIVPRSLDLSVGRKIDFYQIFRCNRCVDEPAQKFWNHELGFGCPCPLVELARMYPFWKAHT